MKSKKKRNIFVGVGTIASVAIVLVPIAIVLTKEDNRTKNNEKTTPVNKTKSSDLANPPLFPSQKNVNPSLHYPNDKVRSEVFNFLNSSLISSAINSNNPLNYLLSDNNLKDITTKLSSQFLKSGLKDIDFKDVEKILNNFKVDSKILNIVKDVIVTKDNKINYQLLDLIFNKGLVNINKPEYKDQKDILINIIKNLAPELIFKYVSLEALEKIIFTGFSRDDFINLISEVVKKETGLGFLVDFGAKLISGQINTIYSYLPIIKNGIINASTEDWNKTFFHLKDIANLEISTGIKKINLSMILKNKDGIQNDWQLLNVFKRISKQLNLLSVTNAKTNKSELYDVAGAMSNLFNKGLTSLTELQAKQIANIVQWSFDFKQNDLYKKDLEDFKTSIKNVFNGLTNKENKTLDFSEVNKAQTIQDVINYAEKIQAYKIPSTWKGIEQAKNIQSAQNIYFDLGSAKITEEDIIENEDGWFTDRFGLRVTIEKILNEYYDKQGVKLSKNHSEIKNVLEDLIKHTNKDENSHYKLWDKFIDVANSIPTFDKKGKKIIINWPNAFKKIHSNDYSYQPYYDYNNFIDKIMNELLGKDYFLSNNDQINDKITKKLFEDEINTFKIQPILDKIDSLYIKKLYTGKVFHYKESLSSKISQYLNDNIKNYNFHQRKQTTIDNYRKDIERSLCKYKTKNNPTDQKANKSLDLKSLNNNDLEGVQQIYDTAKSILEKLHNGLYDEKNIEQDISKQSILNKIIPVIPPRDYGYELDKLRLNREFNYNSNNNNISKTTYFTIKNIKTISGFLLNGYPKSTKDSHAFKNMISSIIILALDGNNSIIDAAKSLIGPLLSPILKSVEEYHLNQKTKSH